MSEEQVWTVLASYGLKIIQVITEEQRIPKKIYIASRHSLAELKKIIQNEMPLTTPDLQKYGLF